MTTKKYSQPEESPQRVEEPQAAYGLSADHLRMEMMREALRINDTDLLNDALDYIRSLIKPQTTNSCPPCQFTLEELSEILDKSEEDVKAGRVYTHEEVRKMYPEWGLE